MSALTHWTPSLLTIFVYAYVVGTLLWLIVAAPGHFKRQRELIRRVERLERRLSER